MPRGLIRMSVKGPEYPWGGLYGGQIVAQALRAAAATVPNGLSLHSSRVKSTNRSNDCRHEPAAPAYWRHL